MSCHATRCVIPGHHFCSLVAHCGPRVSGAAVGRFCGSGTRLCFHVDSRLPCLAGQCMVHIWSNTIRDSSGNRASLIQGIISHLIHWWQRYCNIIIRVISRTVKALLESMEAAWYQSGLRVLLHRWELSSFEMEMEYKIKLILLEAEALDRLQARFPCFHQGSAKIKSRSSLKLARTDRHNSIVSFLSSGHFKLPSFPEEHIINRVDNVNHRFTWIGCHSAGWRNLDKLTENNLSPCLFVSGKDSNPSRPLLFFAWWDCQQCVWALMRIA